MDSTRTKWLSRKAWRRLVELHASGRIPRTELERLKERLARVRREAAAAPAARPALRLLQGGGAAAAPRHLTPVDQEVASPCG
jgi:multidrug resistance efflux pump